MNQYQLLLPLNYKWYVGICIYVSSYTCILHFFFIFAWIFVFAVFFSFFWDRFLWIPWWPPSSTQPGMKLNIWATCFHLFSAGITGILHSLCKTWVWLSTLCIVGRHSTNGANSSATSVSYFQFFVELT